MSLLLLILLCCCSWLLLHLLCCCWYNRLIRSKLQYRQYIFLSMTVYSFMISPSALYHLGLWHDNWLILAHLGALLPGVVTYLAYIVCMRGLGGWIVLMRGQEVGKGWTDLPVLGTYSYRISLVLMSFSCRGTIIMLFHLWIIIPISVIHIRFIVISIRPRAPIHEYILKIEVILGLRVIEHVPRLIPLIRGHFILRSHSPLLQLALIVHIRTVVINVPTLTHQVIQIIGIIPGIRELVFLCEILDDPNAALVQGRSLWAIIALLLLAASLRDLVHVSLDRREVAVLDGLGGRGLVGG